MACTNIYSYIKFDDYSITPKYLQLTNSILAVIEKGNIEKDYNLPSINDLSYELEISRNTAEKAYNNLKKTGIISSVPGKGYFINKPVIKKPLRIFLILNKLSVHKKIMYDCFAQTLGKNALIDLFVYNNDYPLFEKMILERIKDYSYYVIFPHFAAGGENAFEVINTIPKEKLLVMSRCVSGVHGHFAAVYEDFERNIYTTFSGALERLRKYHTLNIIFAEHTYYPSQIMQGFRRFCFDFGFNYEVTTDLQKMRATEGTAYLSLTEDDLVALVKKIQAAGLEVGKQVGVIAYNETAMMQILLGGITTISADFEMMGIKAARMILDKSTEKVSVPFYLRLRGSL